MSRSAFRRRSGKRRAVDNARTTRLACWIGAAAGAACLFAGRLQIESEPIDLPGMDGRRRGSIPDKAGQRDNPVSRTRTSKVRRAKVPAMAPEWRSSRSARPEARIWDDLCIVTTDRVAGVGMGEGGRQGGKRREGARGGTENTQRCVYLPQP